MHSTSTGAGKAPAGAGSAADSRPAPPPPPPPKQTTAAPAAVATEPHPPPLPWRRGPAPPAAADAANASPASSGRERRGWGALTSPGRFHGNHAPTSPLCVFSTFRRLPGNVRRQPRPRQQRRDWPAGERAGPAPRRALPLLRAGPGPRVARLGSHRAAPAERPAPGVLGRGVPASRVWP